MKVIRNSSYAACVKGMKTLKTPRVSVKDPNAGSAEEPETPTSLEEVLDAAEESLSKEEKGMPPKEPTPPSQTPPVEIPPIDPATIPKTPNEIAPDITPEAPREIPQEIPVQNPPTEIPQRIDTPRVPPQ